MLEEIKSEVRLSVSWLFFPLIIRISKKQTNNNIFPGQASLGISLEFWKFSLRFTHLEMLFIREMFMFLYTFDDNGMCNRYVGDTQFRRLWISNKSFIS